LIVCLCRVWISRRGWRWRPLVLKGPEVLADATLRADPLRAVAVEGDEVRLVVPGAAEVVGVWSAGHGSAPYAMVFRGRFHFVLAAIPRGVDSGGPGGNPEGGTRCGFPLHRGRGGRSFRIFGMVTGPFDE